VALTCVCGSGCRARGRVEGFGSGGRDRRRETIMFCSFRHHQRLARVVAALGVAVSVLSAVPAAACDVIADGPVWSDNCLTDWNHYRVSDLTTGIQVVLRSDGRPGFVFTVDGVYGTSGGGGETPAAVRTFQTSEGIADDGKTGPVTWGRIDNTMSYDHLEGNWKYYTVDVNETQELMRLWQPTYQAYVKKPNGVWVRVDAWRS